MNTTNAICDRFQFLLSKSRFDAASSLPPGVLSLLALVPFWTEAALSAALGHHGDVDSVIAHAAVLLRVEGEPGERVIELCGLDASDVLTHDVVTRERLAAIGERVLTVIGLPPLLREWAELAAQARHATDDEISRALITRVTDACENGRPGDVLDLVEAASTLIRALGQLAGAVRDCHCRIRQSFVRLNTRTP